MKRYQKKTRLPFFLVIIILAIVLVIQIWRPFGKPKIVLSINTNPVIAGSLNINWPENAQGAICVANKGLVDKTRDQSEKSTASVAKIMTAYIILKDHPLGVGESGPTLAVTRADEKTYAQDKKDGQSVVKVVAGEKLNERQMLKALLLPSANNIATILAQWDSGSIMAFVKKMNQTARKLGMKNTHYTDPAGIRLSTRSNACDQLLLSQKAMAIEPFRDIVDMAQTDLPVVGTVYNVNYVLGKGGIVGIKTGSIPEIGGNFVFASYDNVGNRKPLIIGALLGVGGKQPIMDALNDALGVLKKTKGALRLMHVVKKGETIGTVKFRPNHVLSLECTRTLDRIVWPQKQLHLKVTLKKLTLPIHKNDVVGTLTIAGENAQTEPIIAAQSMSKPNLLERLTRL